MPTAHSLLYLSIFLFLIIVMLLGIIIYLIKNPREITDEKRNIKNNFLSIASHQLRTPMTAVRWFLGVLQEEAFDTLTPSQKKLVHDSLVANGQMINTVNDILEIARIEDNNVRIRQEKIDLVKITQTILNNQDLAIKDKNLEIRIDSPNECVFDSDLKILSHVSGNLLHNAIKYSRSNSVIDIKITENKQEIRWEVTDQGIGIPESAQKHLFDKFFRAGNAIKEVADGTGLGLYICREMLNLIKGKINFTSEEGKGSKFYFVVQR